MNVLSTLHLLRRHLSIGSADSSDDDRLLLALESASGMIERMANRRFSPRVASLKHNLSLHDVAELALDEDLLQLTQLINGDGAVIDVANIIALPDNGDAPIAALRLTGASFTYDESPFQAITVSGTWGWHDRWSQAWLNSADTVQNNPLSDTATSVTVVDADGADSFNLTPRFQVGQLLKIDSEYLRVTGINTTTNVLTVLRGVNGTTAAAHNLATAIFIYQPPHDVEMLCLRWAAWLYKEPDGRTDDKIPFSLLRGLDGLRRVSVKV